MTTPRRPESDLDIQRIDVRLVLEAGDALTPQPFLEVFGRWRTEEDRVGRDRILDLADYAHLPLGPRALLVSRDFQLAVDWQREGAGVLLSVRDGLAGSLAERLAHALDEARRRAAELLEAAGVEARLAGPLTVVLNDRGLAPNDDATDAVVRPALLEALGEGDWTVERDERPGRRLAYSVS